MPRWLGVWEFTKLLCETLLLIRFALTSSPSCTGGQVPEARDRLDEIARALEEWYEEKVAQANQFPVLRELHDPALRMGACPAVPQEPLNAIGNMNLDNATFTECPLPNQLQ